MIAVSSRLSTSTARERWKLDIQATMGKDMHHSLHGYSKSNGVPSLVKVLQGKETTSWHWFCPWQGAAPQKTDIFISAGRGEKGAQPFLDGAELLCACCFLNKKRNKIHTNPHHPQSLPISFPLKPHGSVELLLWRGRGVG